MIIKRRGFITTTTFINISLVIALQINTMEIFNYLLFILRNSFSVINCLYGLSYHDEKNSSYTSMLMHIQIKEQNSNEMGKYMYFVVGDNYCYSWPLNSQVN